MEPKYPIYIISKNRYKTRMTADSLEEMGVKYNIVVEFHEVGSYIAYKNPKHKFCRLLPMPEKNNNLGLGSIPARNFVWEHAMKTGAERHWIMDDNLQGFYRYNNNRKIKMACGGGLRAVEDWVDRYKNIAIVLASNMKCSAPVTGLSPQFF
jgi:hypothetical protein